MKLSDILGRAFRVYYRHPATLFLVAAPTIPLGITTILVSASFADLWVLTVVILPIASGVPSLVVVAALVRAVADALEGTAPDFWRSYGAVVSRLGSVVLAALRFEITVQALTIVGVGIPLAAYLFTRWFFFPQAIMLEGKRAGEALKRSGDLVSGSWWRVFGITLLIAVISAAPTVFVSFVVFPGPPGGFGGLGLLSPPAGVSATVTSVIGALMLPFAAGAETILFFDLSGRHARAAVAAS